MSPTDAKRNTTKRKKSKKGSGLGPSSPVNSLEIKTAGSVSSATTLSSSSSPSTSSVVFSLQAAAAIPSPSTGNDLEAAAPLISTERMGSAEVKQKKRCGGTVNSIQTRKRSRMATSSAEVASQVEPIDLEENASEEVVDLTCESSEPVVVDLTHNDSVVIVEENGRRQRRQPRRQPPSDSCVLSSDDDEPRDNDVVLTSTLTRDLELLDDGIASSRRSGTVSCPICMDGYSEIVQSGRLIVSTKCGHVFCSQCLRDSLKNVNSCPTCRKKLGYKQYHPIYI